MPSTRREPDKQPAPKGQPAEQANASREVARLKQRVATLEGQLSSLLKELDARKQFFSSRKP